MSITIIIPTLRLDNTLRKLLLQLPSDVIIVNGGTDTHSLKKNNIINCNPGRGLQLKTGARFAKGDWLFFLHSDSMLADGWQNALQKHMKTDGNKALVFSLRFDDIGFFPRLLEYWARFRSYAFALPYGDQGFFISRKLYEDIGGYNDMPLMEDVDIIQRIGRKRLKLSSAIITTSAKKYIKYGYLIRMVRNGCCLVLYKLGVDPSIIKKIY